MITKKTFVTTSSFLITATLLSQIYSYTTTRYSQSQSLNLSAFSNMAKNVTELTTPALASADLRPISTVNDEIISIISNEVKKKISKTRYAISTIKPRLKLEQKVLVAAVPELVKPSAEVDLSAYEINSKELINLYSLSVDQLAYTKFENIKIATINNVVLDEVIVGQASTEPSTEQTDEVTIIQRTAERDAQTPAVTEIKNSDEAVAAKPDDEMVMFDYSDKTATPAPVVEKSIDQKLYERPLSNTVKQAINREIGIAPIKKLAMNTQKITPATTRIDNEDIDLGSDQNIVYDYSQDADKKGNDAEETKDAINAFSAPAKTELQNTQFFIRAREINLNTHKSHQAHSFEFVPDYDRAERNDDQSSGEINLGYSLAGSMNTQTGIVQSKGMIPTRVELNLGSAKGIEIPLINEEGIQKFLQKQGLSVKGNLLLIAVDPSIIESEIDSTYSHRFFFDKNFKMLEGNAGASYVLYAGVKSGNVMLRYLLNNKESAQKIVYVGDGEMYFEDPDFSDSNRETFTFTTRNLLGQKKKELIIDGSLINYFNTSTNAKKKALNAYEMKVPVLVSGMRKYFEFKHLNDSVFVGSSEETEMEIPGNDFIAKVLDMNQVSSLKERCVVQLNLSKDIREIKANGKNKSGEMFVETSFIDNDGNFSRDSELSEKAFVVGDMEGLFSVRVDYTDGSTEFLKTFCSEGTYLVEQL